MKIEIFCIVLVFFTKTHGFRKPILNCGFQKTFKRICASNGRTYLNECDFQQSKVFGNPKLYILHYGECNDRGPKQQQWYYEEKSPPQYIPEGDSHEIIIEEYETRPRPGLIGSIIQKKIDIAKNIISSIGNYDRRRIKKRIIKKKNPKKGCLYCVPAYDDGVQYDYE